MAGSKPLEETEAVTPACIWLGGLASRGQVSAGVGVGKGVA